eukprot:1317429-Pyramimonas_sp.AAC.1
MVGMILWASDTTCGTFKNRRSRSSLSLIPIKCEAPSSRLPPTSPKKNITARSFSQCHSGMALPLGNSQDQNPVT